MDSRLQRVVFHAAEGGDHAGMSRRHGNVARQRNHADGKGYINLYEVYGEEAFAEIVKRDPQVIMSPYWPGAFDYEVTTIYEIMTRPGFDQTEAVKTGRVCYYDSSLMKRFGPRTITAIENLAYLLHPYYFKNPENSVSPWELGKIDVAENFPAPLN